MNMLGFYRAITAGLVLVSVSLPLASHGHNEASSQQDPIANTAWSWSWGPAPMHTVKDCPGGSGTLTVTSGENGQSVAFKGQGKTADGETFEIPTKSGNWSYVGIENGKRAYEFAWGNGTDGVTLSEDGQKLRGRSGPCAVEGERKTGTD